MPARGPLGGTGADDGGPRLPKERRLLAYRGGSGRNGRRRNETLSADEQAVAMVAAAVGYHRREEKQFWWAHFDRLDAPVEDWSDDRERLHGRSRRVVSRLGEAELRAATRPGRADRHG